MGLPLFVAPVESDLPPKIGDKSNNTRQARSSIRRPRRNVDSRPFRRRAALLRDNFPTPGPEPVPQSAPRPRSAYPWIESGNPPPPEAYGAPPLRTTPPEDTDRPTPSAESNELREALREMQSQGIDVGDARLISLFGERWVLENVSPPRRSNVTSPPALPEDGSSSSQSHPFLAEIGERFGIDLVGERRRWHRARLDPSTACRRSL
ncbi:hypothetical protein CTRI78_v001916 [Colletotrichum trifolii]|uniref:Uncharacterized protein n=1 Tax=Colletotrichum trifolii TaxID=5466 RepID=A0A4R8RVF4_COLTR|nr:hypothetical protein CTRI78_v001916 [Colletotrichum trifolii]